MQGAGERPIDLRLKPSSCNGGTCQVIPVDCQVSAFSGWTTGSKSCGAAPEAGHEPLQRSQRTAEPLAPPSRRARTATPKDAQSIAKSAVSVPSAPVPKNCGGGTHARTRTITVQPQNGGQACPPLSETEACNTQACAPTGGGVGQPCCNGGACNNASQVVCASFGGTATCEECGGTGQPCCAGGRCNEPTIHHCRVLRPTNSGRCAPRAAQPVKSPARERGRFSGPPLHLRFFGQ